MPPSVVQPAPIVSLLFGPVATAHRPAMVDGMGARVKRYFIPALVGFAPLVTFLMTWDVASYGTLSSVIRALSLPELAAELGTVAIAFVEGMLPWLRRLGIGVRTAQLYMQVSAHQAANAQPDAPLTLKEFLWLVTDNNGTARAKYPNDTRPTLFKCRRVSGP